MIATVGQRAIVRVQNPVHLGRHDEPQPDIALVTPPASKYRRRHPDATDVLLLIEVAETSLRVDRDLRLGLYARCAIPEVWLVDLKAGRVTRFRNPGETGYGESEILALDSPVPVPGLHSPPSRVDLTGLL